MAAGNKLWGSRLKEIREQTNFSQKELGILAGIDEFVASTRINRYETGKHKADYQISQRLADILNIPTGYLYTEDDKLAELMLIFHRASQKKKNEFSKAALKIFE